jgi:hypothetical protein
VSSSTQTAESASSWFPDLDKAALFASLMGWVTILIPVWNTIQTIRAVGTTRPLQAFMTVAALLAVATLPVFYLALYKNARSVRFPKQHRILALLAAIVVALTLLVELPQWFASLAGYLTAMTQLDWSNVPAAVTLIALAPSTAYQVSTVLSDVSNVALILLLIALAQQVRTPEEIDVPISRFLRIATWAALIVWGLWLALSLFRGLIAPYGYVQLRNYAAQTGRAAPAAIDIIGELFKTILSAACLFIAPYIVFRSHVARQKAAKVGDPPEQQVAPL